MHTDAENQNLTNSGLPYQIAPASLCKASLDVLSFGICLKCVYMSAVQMPVEASGDS